MKKENLTIKKWITKSGYEAIIKRIPLGHLCGYIGIPKEHILYNKDYSDDLIFLPDSMEYYFDVHGGITFSGFFEEYKKELYWIGFDCAHGDDTPKKCNIVYVIKECEKLSKQLKNFEIKYMEKGNIIKIRAYSDIINEMINYCDLNIIELLEMEKVLKPFENINNLRFKQLTLTREFLYAYREKVIYRQGE